MYLSLFMTLCYLNCSVGIPYKEAIIGCCDEVHPLAQVDLMFTGFQIQCL